MKDFKLNICKNFKISISVSVNMFFKRLQSYFATDEFLMTWGLRWHKTERIMVKVIVVVVLFCFVWRMG